MEVVILVAIGYRSLAMDVLGMNDAIWNGTLLCFKL